MSEVESVAEVVSRWKSLVEDEAAEDSARAEAFRSDAARVLAFLEKSMDAAEKAQAVLENAYSVPGDSEGIRIQSEDAVKLQWALRSIGIGDDSGQPCFTV